LTNNPGENSIIITAGANRAPWDITEEIKQVRDDSVYSQLTLPRVLQG
jgi:hypothetical protein